MRSLAPGRMVTGVDLALTQCDAEICITVIDRRFPHRHGRNDHDEDAEPGRAAIQPTGRRRGESA